jgi:hypothetical protein
MFNGPLADVKARKWIIAEELFSMNAGKLLPFWIFIV